MTMPGRTPLALWGLQALLLLLGSDAAEAATKSSRRLRSLSTKAKTEERKKGYLLGTIVDKFEGFVSSEANLIGGGGSVDFGGADDQDNVDFKLSTGPALKEARGRDPGALGAAVDDEFGGDYRDEELPFAPTYPANHPAKHTKAPANVGEYADVQNGLLPRPAKPFGAALASLSAKNATGGSKALASLAERKKVVAEYDLGPPEESAAEKELSEEEQENRNDGTVLDGEKMTKEDMRRLAKKDGVIKLKDPKSHRSTSRRLRRLGGRGFPRRRVVLRSSLQSKQYSAGKKRAKHVVSTKTSQAQLRQNLQSAEDAMAPGAAKMKGQCMSFATFLAGQDIQGPELMRTVKSTCNPAVMAGTASPAYSTMCNALGGAVEEFVVSPTWDAGALCDAMLRVFNEAKIGDLAR